MTIDIDEGMADTPTVAGTDDAAVKGDTGVISRISLLIPFARDDASRYVWSGLLATAGTACQLGVYYVIFLAVGDVLEGEANGSGLFRLALGALVLVVGHYVFLALSTFASHRAAFGTLYRLRLEVGERLGRVPLGSIAGRRSGEIQRTMSDDIERLELFLAHAIPDLVSGLLIVAGTTIWMFTVDWRMATAAVACLIVAFALMSIGVARSQALMGGYMSSMGRMNGSIVEMVRGLPAIRVFNRTGDTFAEAREATVAAAEYQADWGRRFLPLLTAFYTLAAAPALVIVPLGLLLWINDAIATEDVVFFLIVGLGYGAPVVKLLDFIANLSHLSYGATLVNDLRSAGRLPEADRPADLVDASVEFDAAAFRYDGAETDAIRDITFRAEPRTITALVGPSGAGKSTIARLVCRFFDVDSGAVRVGGVDVRDIPFSQLMDHVAFVFQETFLFDDTIEANLRLAKPAATQAELEAACRAARAHDFVTALPDGYATRVGSHGSRLSGGERQRLAIARAFLKDTEIVVLDEATAFVDPENEVALQEAIDALVSDRTVLMVAHRLSTIAGADQILVIDGGRVVERGRHAQLLARDGLYSRMWRAFESAERIALGDAVHVTDSTTAGDQA